MSEKYDKMRRPPVYALREIKGGRMNGKTDINPQWRYEIMDATFGMCGIGWKYEIVRLWTEPAPASQVMCFSEIKVYVKDGDKWSDPIPGIGGSMLIEQESKGLHVSDEGFKMATTDALSVALKMLGVAGDIYAGLWDGAKYKDVPKPVDGKELETLVITLESYIESGIISGDNEVRARRAIEKGNIESIIEWIGWAKKKEAGK
jgi:hypothetical protein